MAFADKVYNYIFTNDNPHDAAYKNWPFGGAAYKFWFITLAYIAFVFRIGPRLMRDRPPFSLRGVLLVYNTLQIITNLTAFCIAMFLLTTYPTFYDIGCLLCLPAGHESKMLEVITVYLYYILKLFDYCDTIFFVLRKSYKQVTFLHVYHHALMGMMGHLYLRLHGLGGHLAIVGVVNSLIHTVMYGYYLISALRPGMKESLWWKKYITIIQLVQFVILVVHQAWPLIMRPDCTFPHVWLYMSILQALLMIWLFSNFYIKTYVKRPKSIKTT